MSGEQAVQLFTQPAVRRVMVLLAMPDQADLHGRHVKGQRCHLQGDHGLHLLLTYECVAVEGGCEFVRTLEYGFAGWPMRLANGLLMRRRIERESLASMQALHDVLARI